MKYRKTNLDNSTIDRLRDEFLSGDDKAYSAIYELYSKDLYAFGLSLHAKTELIEDAIHDIFVDIYTHRQNLAKVDNLKFYFIAAFRNRLFFLIKKESHTFEITENDIPECEEKNSQDLWIEKEETAEKETLVKRLLSELNSNQREAIYLRFVEGLSCDEIAQLKNINYQSAKNIVHRAILKLKTVEAFPLFLFSLFLDQFRSS